MIDEEHLSQEEEKSPLPEDLLDVSDESDHIDDHLTDDWKKVRSDRRNQHIELKDLTEENFLQLTESKNQDARFYSWLNF